MARIRTVKPELWEDEVVGLLPRDARLLFIATFNLADDEGLLRWTPAYLKASAFMYDDDLTVPHVAKLMHCLADAGLVFPYIAGVARQQMAVVVNFRKHQRINRPQKSKLPPPSLQNGEARRMYARRDNWTCQLCGGGIPERPVTNDAHNLTIGHRRLQSAGGTDHPSNVRATHKACDRYGHGAPEEEFSAPPEMQGLSDSLNDSLNHSVNGAVSSVHNRSDAHRDDAPPSDPDSYTHGEICSVNHSVNGSLNGSLTSSLLEGKGREGNREGKGTPLPPAGEQSGSPAVVETGERAIEDRMTDAFLDRFKAGNAYGRRQVRRTIADTLANDTDPDELWRALLRIGETSKPVSAGTLQFAFADIRKTTPSNVVDLATGQPLVGTDAKVAAHSALTEQLRALEARETS